MRSRCSQAQLRKEAEEDNRYRQQLEQERRDHELAMRLAQETNGQVEESPLLARKYVLLHKQLILSIEFEYCTYKINLSTSIVHTMFILGELHCN